MLVRCMYEVDNIATAAVGTTSDLAGKGMGGRVRVGVGEDKGDHVYHQLVVHVTLQRRKNLK